MSNPIRVLHVDDSPLDRELVRDALVNEAEGYEVQQTASRGGFEAALEEGGFDIVLSDFNILGYEGLQVLDAVHERFPGVPVIITTGTGSEEVAAAALRMGAADYIIKTPSHIQRLPHTITTVLQKEALRREREEASAAVRRAEQKYRSIFINATEGIFQTRPDGRYLSANPALARLYGYASLEELIAELSAHSLYCDPQRRAQFIEQIERDGRVVDFESQVYRADGATIWISENARVTIDDNGQEIFEGTVKDITERKLAQLALEEAKAELEQRVQERTAALSAANERLRLELEERASIEAALRQAKDEAERATHAKSAFLSRMSHELRTPMNAVLGFGQLLEMDDLNEEQSESVDQIMRAGRHLLELINEILDISRIESGRLHMAAESVPVSPTIEECVALLRPQAHSHRVQIWHTDIASLRVQADPRRLKQILLNLLSNAIKYNRPGGTVIVTCAQLQDSPVVRFKVTDTGLGIPPEKLEHLFLPFERLHTEESAVEGSGLGLALTKRLAEAMGGSIGVESSTGNGSTFWIDLPRAESPDEATQD